MDSSVIDSYGGFTAVKTPQYNKKPRLRKDLDDEEDKVMKIRVKRQPYSMVTLDSPLGLNRGYLKKISSDIRSVQ